jgi:hypothetical protein
MTVCATLWEWLRTLWRGKEPLSHSVERQPSQGEESQTQGGRAWATGLPQGASAQELAGAFRRWAQSQSELTGRGLAAWWVKELYQEARQDGWPSHREFARELGLLMPRGRRWIKGKALTFYWVRAASAEVLTLPERRSA